MSKRTLFTFSGPPETRQDFPLEARETWAARVRVRSGFFPYVFDAAAVYEQAAQNLVADGFPEGTCPGTVPLWSMRRVQVVHVTSSGARLHAPQPAAPFRGAFWGVPFQADHLAALPGGCCVVLLPPAGNDADMPVVCHTLAIEGATLLCTAPVDRNTATRAAILGSAAPVSMLVPEPAGTSVMIREVPGWLVDDIYDRVPRSAP